MSNYKNRYDLNNFNIKKPMLLHGLLIYNANPGNVLLSHIVTNAVPSAMKGLTSVFGMGTGIALSL